MAGKDGAPAGPSRDPLIETERVAPDRLVPNKGPCLLVVAGGAVSTHALPVWGEVFVGRSPECAVCVDDASLSRKHAVIRIAAGVTIEDLGSTNGTHVRGRDLVPGQVAELSPGEPFQLGTVTAAFHRGPPAPVATAPVEPVACVSDAMKRLYEQAERIAPSEVAVLILGETGVGKEVLARLLHRRSHRADRPLVCLNCSSLTESLLESELFGHEKGAFTGAHQRKAGLLESADSGTVFLDEVGELPASSQAKLLRVLEDRQLRPVGAVHARPIDVRFISATNRDLERDHGGFRRDLFYRLDGVSLTIPPLRERAADVRHLAEAFLAARRPGARFSGDVLALLQRHGWPGNVRELRNVVERAVLFMGDGAQVEREHLPDALVGASPRAAVDRPDPADRLRRDRTELEREDIVEALQSCGANQKEAAALLGISARTLATKMDALGIPRPRKSRR